ncbi:MAG: hypothetical protein JW863_22720, partial [Chitinispirillaceae bacterium]|nr:hypothetical protein [Chitinispirillaceae bacterium]
MRIRFFSVATLLISASAIFFLICTIPSPPPGPEQAEVDVYLKSSTGVTSFTSITDTVGNFDTIGVILHLTQHIDSTIINVVSDDSVEHHFSTTTKKAEDDTVFFTVSFASPGERSVNVTGYINGANNSEESAIIHVVSRPDENH